MIALQIDGNTFEIHYVSGNVHFFRFHSKTLKRFLPCPCNEYFLLIDWSFIRKNKNEEREYKNINGWKMEDRFSKPDESKGTRFAVEVRHSKNLYLPV